MSADAGAVQLGMPNSCERLSVYAHRLYYSKLWSTFYVLMIICNLAAIIALIAVHATGHPTETPTWLLLIEIMVNLLLVLELAVRMVAQQLRFFKDACNLFDFTVALLCVGLFVIYIESPAEDKDEALLGTIVLAVRYAVVFARMVHITVQVKSRNAQLDTDDVDFTLMEEDGAADIPSPITASSRTSRADSFGDDF